MHHFNRRLRLALFCLVLLVGSATLHAQRFIYTFSGRVTQIFDHYGVLTASNYYRTGDVVTASFLVDLSAPGFQILNDGSRFAMIPFETNYMVWEPFYSRLLSGPLMPDFHAEWASHPEHARHYLYGGNQTQIYTNPPIVSRTSTLTGGSAASYLHLLAGERIQDWSEGMTAFGVANAAIDQGGGPSVTMDLRLDSITPAFNLHTPKPLPSVPQAINIPGLIESTNYAFFVLGGRTPHTRVKLNASPSVDGDGDPLYFDWFGPLRPYPIMGFLGFGEAPVVSLLIPGTQPIGLRATDGSLEGAQEFSVTVYTPAQATELMRNAVRGLPASYREKTTALTLLQKATSSFQRADWRRGVQFLQTFEQFMARSAYTIPTSKRTSFISLSRSIRRAVAQPQ
jgi:hypothetical protein